MQLKSELVRILADTEQGTLDLLRADEEAVVRGAFAALRIEGAWHRTTDPCKRTWQVEESVDAEGRPVRRGVLSCTGLQGAPDFQWWAEAGACSPLVRIGIAVFNRGRSPVKIEAFAPLALEAKAGGALEPGTKADDYHVLLNTEGEGVVCLRDLAPGKGEEGRASGAHEGWWDGALHNVRTGRGIVLGALSARRFKTRLRMEANAEESGDSPLASLWVEQEAFERLLPPGGRLEAEPVGVNFAEQTEVAYRTYARAAGREMEAKFLPEIPGGWCSWYVPFTEIDEAFILENARTIAARRDIFPGGPEGFKYVLIDWGWQADNSTGANEWDAAKFPRGMKAVARSIRELGLKPGLWIAPAQVAGNTRAFARYPHIGVKSSKGGNFLVQDWLARFGAMVPDCTLAEGRRFLQQRIREILCEWGFEMLVLEETDIAGAWRGARVVTPEGLKVDEEAQAVYHDPDITPVEHHRLLVRTCLDAARASGCEVFVAPCGGPHLPNTGLFSLNVCSPDGAWEGRGITWESDKGSPRVQAQNLAYRYYLHGNLWTLDREGYCVSEPRPLSEAIVDICSAALSGGFALCGDDLPRLTEERFQVIARCLPFYGVAARPIGLFEEHNPVIWNLKARTDFERWEVVAVFNYSADRAEQTVRVDFSRLGLNPAACYLAFDFWKSEFLGEQVGSLEVSVPGRSLRLIALRGKRGHPQLVGSDVHYTMGARELLYAGWSASAKRLQLAYRCPRQAQGRLFLYVPQGWRLKPASVAAFQPAQIAPRLWALTVPYSPEVTTIEAGFE